MLPGEVNVDVHFIGALEVVLLFGLRFLKFFGLVQNKNLAATATNQQSWLWGAAQGAAAPQRHPNHSHLSTLLGELDGACVKVRRPHLVALLLVSARKIKYARVR